MINLWFANRIAILSLSEMWSCTSVFLYLSGLALISSTVVNGYGHCIEVSMSSSGSVGVPGPDRIDYCSWWIDGMVRFRKFFDSMILFSSGAFLNTSQVARFVFD